MTIIRASNFFSALFALLPFLANIAVAKDTAPAFRQCASQWSNKSISDATEARKIIQKAATSLHQGTSSLLILQAGQLLFCRDDNSNWHQVVADGDQEYPTILQRITKHMLLVDEAGRILQVDGEMRAGLARRGLGSAPALISYGRTKNRTTGMHFPSKNLLVLNIDDEGANSDEILVHEALGHLLFYTACSAPKVEACKADPTSFIWRIITEADAFAKQIAYAVYKEVVEHQPVASISSRMKGHDGVRFLTIAKDILKDNPEFEQVMKSEHKVPKKLLAMLLEAFVVRTPVFYFREAADRKPPFGSNKDLDGSLASIAGYLDDSSRAKVAQTIRNSTTFKALSGAKTISQEQLKPFMKN